MEFAGFAAGKCGDSLPDRFERSEVFHAEGLVPA
jgi:hypothetical protein